MNDLVHIEEPNILFAHGQKCQDPRDGLSLFGPLPPHIYGIRGGVVATKDGLKIFEEYLQKLQQPIYNYNNTTRPFFPGFEAVFGCKWEANNILFKEVKKKDIDECLYIDSNYVRTYDMVTVFINKIITSINNDDEKVDVWFVVVPDEVYKYCRPKSTMESNLVKRRSLLSKVKAKRFVASSFLFPEMQKEEDVKEKEAQKYSFDAQFHDQFKARMLEYSVPTQILRESTLAWQKFTNSRNKPLRDFSKIEGHLAWTISTAAYYKAGGKPWKLSDIRPGVCYLGLVYKKIESSKNPKNACCAAQMFLDSGDGTIFRGEVGPWYNPQSKEYHLRPKEARALLTQAVNSYRDTMNQYPKEIFIHAKTRFNRDEWFAFREAVPDGTNLVGITISNRESLKLYKQDGAYPIIRGTSLIIDEKNAFLWTVGYVPRIQTALSLEVPNPIRISINKGNADIHQVLKDIMALTKLNYNACIFGDGIPVTLRFADKIGEILTACPEIKTPPLAFKYYI